LYIYDAPLCDGNIQERCTWARKILENNSNRGHNGIKFEFAEHFQIRNMNHLLDYISEQAGKLHQLEKNNMSMYRSYRRVNIKA
jgi:hypothetical protein